MEDLLSPLAHTSNQLDTRLSWHLAQSIDSALSSSSTTISTTISLLCLDTLCDSYACQLASLDMWHWAVFVLMHMQGDERRRESCVRLYLAKNVTSESELSERELFCIEKLRVPESWVYECKAMRAKCVNEHENQFELLLKAKKWNEAHAVLIEFLAPDMLLRRKKNSHRFQQRKN
jgi:nuclear pore complex protein Nup98-Nup96